MKWIILICLSFTSISSFSQFTSIPDSNFEQALIDLGLDSGTPNGSVLTSNIDTIVFLGVSQKNISDLTGIEDFTLLETLSCGGNPLTSINTSNNLFLKELYTPACQITALDLSSNSLLEYLYCANNQITSLDLSNNPLLYALECQNNLISSLDISINTELYYFDCGISNQLTSLDVSHCDTLRFLYCDNNQLECLNIKNGNNDDPMILEAVNNPNLTCIEVDDPNWANANWSVTWGNIDPGMSFSSYCGNACTTGTEEITSSQKKLIKVVNLMGQEVDEIANGVLINIYSDGSSEKVFNKEN